jgi:hypothetical protein
MRKYLTITIRRTLVAVGEVGNLTLLLGFLPTEPVKQHEKAKCQRSSFTEFCSTHDPDVYYALFISRRNHYNLFFK